MKKYILGFLVLGLLIGLPLSTKASTLTDLEARIASLTSQVQSLSVRLGAQVISSKTVTPTLVLPKTSVSTTQKLTASTSTNIVAPKLPNLPAGCVSSIGYSSVSGISCGCNNGNVYSDYNGQLCPINSKIVTTISTPAKTTIKLTPTQTTAIAATASGDLNKRVLKLERAVSEILNILTDWKNWSKNTPDKKVKSLKSELNQNGNNNVLESMVSVYCNGSLLFNADTGSSTYPGAIASARAGCSARFVIGDYNPWALSS